MSASHPCLGTSQLYHNPRLVTLLEKIIVGTSVHDAGSSPDADQDTVIELINPFMLPHREFNQRPIPHDIKWKHMFGTILRYKAVPIGLYRGVAAPGEEGGLGNRYRNARVRAHCASNSP